MIPALKTPEYWRTLRIDLRTERDKSEALGARFIGSIRDDVDEIVITDSTGCERIVKRGEYLEIDVHQKFTEHC